MDYPAGGRPEVTPELEGQHEPDYLLLDNAAYIARLQQDIPTATERVWVQTMSFDAHGPFAAVRDLMVDAAERQVDTRFTTDSYYRLFLGGSVHYARYASRRKRDKIDAIATERDNVLEQIDKAGVGVTVTNPPKGLYQKINPASGRNHVKMAIIDDVAYVGDINLVDRDKRGLMVRVKDPVIVNALAELYVSAAEGKGPDMRIEGHDGTTLLVDGGTPGQSTILEQAIGMVNRAERKIHMANQYLPDGPMVAAIDTAINDSDVRALLYATKSDILSPTDALFNYRNRMLMQLRGTYLPVFHLPYWIHSKVLAKDLENRPSSASEVLIGTHCLSGAGVSFGTQEVALHSRNEALLKQMAAYFTKLTLDVAGWDGPLPPGSANDTDNYII